MITQDLYQNSERNNTIHETNFVWGQEYANVHKQSIEPVAKQCLLFFC